MFSRQQRHEIADKVQAALRETNDQELPSGEIEFILHLRGAVIRNNSAEANPSVDPEPVLSRWNKVQRAGGTPC